MNYDHYRRLLLAVEKAKYFDYPVQSRVHRLRSFPENCFVKRDDELGFGISGSKIRKFRTLLPDLTNRRIHTVIVIGGAYSNNVLGVVQLLVENGIRPVLFLLGDGKEELQGIHLFIRMLIKKDDIHWVSRDQWPEVLFLAEKQAEELMKKGNRAIVLPEGSATFSAIPGASSLALDMIRNEKFEERIFDHIFLDAGTGFQAIITMLSYAFMEKETHFSIVLMAGVKEDFEDKLKSYHAQFEEWLGQEVAFPNHYELLFPSISKSFGSINAHVIKSILHFGREEGILTDPIYSGKLFDTAKKAVENHVVGNTLIVHSGGGLSLSGFQSKLSGKIKDFDE